MPAEAADEVAIASTGRSRGCRALHGSQGRGELEDLQRAAQHELERLHSERPAHPRGVRAILPQEAPAEHWRCRASFEDCAIKATTPDLRPQATSSSSASTAQGRAVRQKPPSLLSGGGICCIDPFCHQYGGMRPPEVWRSEKTTMTMRSDPMTTAKIKKCQNQSATVKPR